MKEGGVKQQPIQNQECFADFPLPKKTVDIERKAKQELQA